MARFVAPGSARRTSNSPFAPTRSAPGFPVPAVRSAQKMASGLCDPADDGDRGEGTGWRPYVGRFAISRRAGGAGRPPRPTPRVASVSDLAVARRSAKPGAEPPPSGPSATPVTCALCARTLGGSRRPFDRLRVAPSRVEGRQDLPGANPCARRAVLRRCRLHGPR